MNKIEQLELALKDANNPAALVTQKQLSEWFNRNERLIKDSLEISLEIAKGEASVMRWVENGEEPIHLNKDTHALIRGSNPFVIDSKGIVDYYDTYATFNGSPVIPTPNKEGE